MSINKSIANRQFTDLVRLIKGAVELIKEEEKVNTAFLCMKLLTPADRDKLADLFPNFFVKENQRKVNELFEFMLNEAILEHEQQKIVLSQIMKDLQDKEELIVAFEKVYKELTKFNISMSTYFSSQQKATLNILLAELAVKIKKLELEISMLTHTINILSENLLYHKSEIKNNINLFVNLIKEKYSNKLDDEFLIIDPFNFGDLSYKHNSPNDELIIKIDVNKVRSAVSERLVGELNNNTIELADVKNQERRVIKSEVNQQIDVQLNHLEKEEKKACMALILRSEKYRAGLNEIESHLISGNEGLISKMDALVEKNKFHVEQASIIDLKLSAVSNIIEHIEVLKAEWEEAISSRIDVTNINIVSDDKIIDLSDEQKDELIIVPRKIYDEDEDEDNENYNENRP